MIALFRDTEHALELARADGLAGERLQGGRVAISCPNCRDGRQQVILEMVGGVVSGVCNRCRADALDVAELLLPVPVKQAAGSVASVAWPEGFGADAYYGLAGEFVIRLDPCTEADPAAILVQMLVAVGNAIGRRAYWRAEGDRHFGNMFAVVVGATSSGRKGSGSGRALGVVRDADAGWRECVVSGLASGEGLIHAVRDPVTRIDTDKDGTERLVVVDEGVSDKRLLVVETEFASVLRQAGRDGSILSTTIRQAWDTGDLRVLTKTTPTRATGGHISIIGHVTVDELRRELKQTDKANGFGNRILWVLSRRSKLLPEGGGAVDLGDVPAGVAEAVRFGQALDQEIRRNDEARDLWRSVYPRLTAGRDGMYGAITGRAEAQVMRLAMLYAILDCSKVITVRHLRAGLEVWRYCDDSARYIFGGASGDATSDRILQAVVAAGRKGLTRNQLQRQVFHGHGSVDVIEAALEGLRAAGKLVSEKLQTSGRPTEVWRPAIYASEASEGVAEPPGAGLISLISLPSQPSGGER